MDVKIEKSWKDLLQDEFKKPYFEELTNFVREEYKTKKVFPPPKDIFKAFDLCPFDKVKVVILGQDPYHGPGQAHGLCFSVNKDIPTPPSLVNIYKEIVSDIEKPIPDHGNLEHWAKQGVFLPNATLTVVAHMAGSHQKKGWETFTDEVIRLISEKKEHVVFMLWGAYAQDKSWMIDETKHLILKAPHPSPLSAHRGFFGCKHFSQANEYLKAHDLDAIEWA
ncbi:MAG TPA: uracil-DNA glycosylase [Thermodesulforhabdus norvegica]|uniref:Uracil-DNA glycosylase n=1 Tax=Thermodesulforhabdus norvegica TaxID=39841 RepID=A0A7C0WV10_9BACT|nr:uracil-DNA glycosylase [Thermodesulforhabdus norvegica]